MDTNGNVALQRWNPNQGQADLQWGVDAVSGEPAGALVVVQAGYLSYWPEQRFSTYTTVISTYRLVQGGWQQSLIGQAAWAYMGNPQFVVPLGNQVLVVRNDFEAKMIAGSVWWRQ